MGKKQYRWDEGTQQYAVFDENGSLIGYEASLPAVDDGTWVVTLDKQGSHEETLEYEKEQAKDWANELARRDQFAQMSQVPTGAIPPEWDYMAPQYTTGFMEDMARARREGMVVPGEGTLPSMQGPLGQYETRYQPTSSQEYKAALDAMNRELGALGTGHQENADYAAAFSPRSPAHL